MPYQYREYHFKTEQLKPSQPQPSLINLVRIHVSENILGLVLAFHISFALSSRTTARILREVFQVRISYQTVLNYSPAAAFSLHFLNLKYKGDVFFFIAQKGRQITAYHVADNQGTLLATITTLEATRTVEPDVQPVFTTDGNPSYPAGLHFINAERLKNQQLPIQLHQVIGLQNLDSESQAYRKFKQLIERFNRT